MYRRIICNDIKNSKFITLTTIMFTALCTMLISLAAILFVQLLGSIDHLMMKAESSHFMQMHSGEINRDRLETFALQNETVDKFQIIEFLNMEGSNIILNDSSLSDSVQDNGISTQSESFDYLLDLDGNMIHPKEKEIYVPISYKKEYSVKSGDTAIIAGRKLIVAGFLRDSQMNSNLSSSKRFLVSQGDYEAIKESGNVEYLIEFRLNQLSDLSKFEDAYTRAGLEANGPTVTYPLFKMLSALSDGMMIAIILFVSVLVIAMTFLCIRFILLAKIEEDYKEIGVMKAIGIRLFDIKKIYLAKYFVITLIGCVFGYLSSLLFKESLLSNIRMNLGESENGPLADLFGGLGILFVFVIVMIYINHVLSQFKKISGAKALRSNTKNEESVSNNIFRLSNNRFLNTNVFLGIKDVLIRRKLYTVLFLVLILSTFILVVPGNLYSTLLSPNFITYMGVGNSDMRFDVSQTEGVSNKTSKIVQVLRNDSNVSKYSVLTTKAFTMKREDGNEKSIKVELGNHQLFPLQYEKGHAPTLENEIALSVMNAEELGKGIGDSITLTVDNKAKILTVCGIYSDITNGGKTAKAAFLDDAGDIIWSVICVMLNDKTKVEDMVSSYKTQFDFAKVSGIDAYVQQTFGDTLKSMKMAAVVSALVAITLLLFVTLLFMKMLIVKDRYSIAVMKVLGFHRLDIISQYMAGASVILLIGVLLGTLLSNTLGEVIASVVIQSFGVASFHFHINPFASYVRCPIMLASVMLIAVLASMKDTETIKIAEHIKE